MNYDKLIADLVVRVQQLEETVSRLVQFSTSVTQAVILMDERIKKSENVR